MPAPTPLRDRLPLKLESVRESKHRHPLPLPAHSVGAFENVSVLDRFSKAWRTAKPRDLLDILQLPDILFSTSSNLQQQPPARPPAVIVWVLYG